MAVSLFLVESDFHGFEMKAFWASEGLLPIVQNGVRLTALPQGISQSSAHCYFLLSTPLSKKDVCYLLNQLYGAYPEKHKCVKLLSREAGKIRTLNARQCHSCCLTKFSFPRKLGLSWGGQWKVPRGLRHSGRESQTLPGSGVRTHHRMLLSWASIPDLLGPVRSPCNAPADSHLQNLSDSVCHFCLRHR